MTQNEVRIRMLDRLLMENAEVLKDAEYCKKQFKWDEPEQIGRLKQEQEILEQYLEDAKNEENA